MDTIESARAYLARLANFPGRHDSIDQIAALVDALAAAQSPPTRWDRELGTVPGYVVVQVGGGRPICLTYDEYDQAREGKE